MNKIAVVKKVQENIFVIVVIFILSFLFFLEFKRFISIGEFIVKIFPCSKTKEIEMTSISCAGRYDALIMFLLINIFFIFLIVLIFKIIKKKKTI